MVFSWTLVASSLFSLDQLMWCQTLLIPVCQWTKRDLWVFCLSCTCPCCFRLLSGRTCSAPWVCSSTSRWTPSTGSKPGAPTAALHWGSCLTTAATPSPPVRLATRQWRYPPPPHAPHCPPQPSQSSQSPFLCLVSAVFVVLGTSIAVQMGTNPDWMFFCCFAGMFMFYCAHWQTYVSGTLRFGMWVVRDRLLHLLCMR